MGDFIGAVTIQSGSTLNAGTCGHFKTGHFVWPEA